MSTAILSSLSSSSSTLITTLVSSFSSPLIETVTFSSNTPAILFPEALATTIPSPSSQSTLSSSSSSIFSAPTVFSVIFFDCSTDVSIEILFSVISITSELHSFFDDIGSSSSPSSQSTSSSSSDVSVHGSSFLLLSV